MSNYNNSKPNNNYSKEKKKNYIEPEEAKRLNKQSRDEMLITDPAPILSALLIEYTVHNNGTQYQFKSHTENSPSTRFKLHNSGIWAYKNFRTDEAGTIIKLIQEYGGYSYEDALQFYYANMPGSRNYFQEALQLEKLTESYLAEVENKRKELEAKRDANQKLSIKHDSTSKVTNAYPIYSSNEKAKTFLDKRGLNKIPPFIMSIKGEYEKYYEDKDEIIVKNQFGIGVLTGNIKEHIQNIKDKKEFGDDVSGDIHYFEAFKKKDGSVAKTQSFGEKTFSYWLSDDNKNSDTVMIFESKFDAAAAYCHNPKIWTDYSVVIANGVNVAPDISKFIEDNNFKKIINYNQNDFAGVLFSHNIIKDLKYINKKGDYTFVKYEKGEIKQDINDLYKDGKFDDSRFEKSLINQFWNFIKINKVIINEKRAKLSNKNEDGLKDIDEKLLRMIKLKKDLTQHLSEKELNRYKKLESEGFPKDIDKIKTFEKNTGRSIEDLVILHDISQRTKENDDLKEILLNEGVYIMSIKTNKELKEALYKIDISNVDGDYDLEAIEDYVSKNSKDNELNSIIDEWIAYSCENNNKDTIDAAKFFYFADLEFALDRTFKLINIGKNLSNDSVVVDKEKLSTQETNLIVDENTFLEDANVLIDNDEQEIEKVVSTEETINKSERQETKQEIKKEAVKESVSTPTVVEKAIEENNTDEIDLSFEFENFDIILEKLNKELKDVKQLESNNITKEMKKEASGSSKIACYTIWNRLNEKEITDKIVKEQDKDKKEGFVSKRNELGNKCKVNIAMCTDIETSLVSNEAKQTQRIDTKGISSKELVSELYGICNKVSSMVELMKNTLKEIKKNNEVISEQMNQPGI